MKRVLLFLMSPWGLALIGCQYLLIGYGYWKLRGDPAMAGAFVCYAAANAFFVWQALRS